MSRSSAAGAHGMCSATARAAERPTAKHALVGRACHSAFDSEVRCEMLVGIVAVDLWPT
jgi:hypothetical protein